ncbi:DUF3247 family protein [Lysobacter sp. A378]
MSRIAYRVHTAPDEITRLQQLIAQLTGGSHVALQMEDGSEVLGIVVVQPSAQAFFDHDGTEGTNAMVRLVQPAMYQPERAGWRDVWVDRIQSINRIDPCPIEPCPVLPG